MKTPRQYQAGARTDINRLLNNGRNPVLCMPTGTGKTYTACLIIADRVHMGERVFILAPQVEIFEQWCLALHDAGIRYGTVNADGVMGRGCSVYVCMPLSLANILSKIPERYQPDIIITDECHHSMADTWLAIYAYYTRAKRLGLTATPQRTDGKGFAGVYDCMIEPITMREAITQGSLSEPLVIVPEQYALEVPLQNGDYDTQAQAAALGKTRIIGDVIEQYGNIFAGMPCLVACCTYEHAEKMTAAFCGAGWQFAHIHSGLADHERKAMLRRIRTGKLHGLCTVGIGIEGMDIPGLFGLIWLRRTMSVTIYLQFIGRVLRPMDGKRYGIVLDPVGNVFIHGAPDMPRTWSLAGRDGVQTDNSAVPRMQICPHCGVMNAMQNTHCHICKGNLSSSGPMGGKKRGIPAMVDGKLVVLGGDELAARRDEIRAALDAQRKQAHQHSERTPAQPTRAEKLTLLKNGLERRNGHFADAVGRWL